MLALWDQGEATVRTVLDAMNGSGERRWAYTTVMTVMHRLDGKGVVTRRRHGKRDVYRPALTREEYRDARTRAEVDAMIDRYGDVALVAFARMLRGSDAMSGRGVRTNLMSPKIDDGSP